MGVTIGSLADSPGRAANDWAGPTSPSAFLAVS